MKALVLDGSREGDSLTPVAVLGMTSALAGRVDLVEIVKPRELAIASCAGCFGCWTRTPGECVIKDDARDVVGSYVGSDLVVFVTPVTFGGYSSELKKLLDRSGIRRKNRASYREGREAACDPGPHAGAFFG